MTLAKVDASVVLAAALAAVIIGAIVAGFVIDARPQPPRLRRRRGPRRR